MTFFMFCTLLGAQTDTTRYSVFMGSRSAGKQLSWTSNEGLKQHYFYTFNDRGRGPELTEVIQIDDDGEFISLKVSGHDYTKNEVNEQFAILDDHASWTSASEEGSADYHGEYYYPINGTIGGKELLIRMLNSGGGSVKLLPAGTMDLVVDKKITLDGLPLNLYGVTGVSYAPSFYWIDADGKLFATVSPSRGISCIRQGHESLKPSLIQHQLEQEDAYYKNIARTMLANAPGKLVITNVDLFDAQRGELIEDQTVTVEDGRITGIFDTPNLKHDGDELIIDGNGKTLLPGFFDMHVHIDKSDGLLHLAGGVTSVRDMAVQINYVQDKQQLARSFDEMEMIGPRIVGLCGFIDGSGPFTRDMGIDDVDQGLQWIDEFAGQGIKQIKLYSSIKPEWVRPLAERAHHHGMVVSGHIPAFMTATQAIRQGYDEIQHTNMLFLNFYGDTLDTRNMTRFSAVGEHGHGFDFASPAFLDFVDLLKQEDVIVDPTLAIFEWGFRSVPGEASPTYAKVVHRLPLTDRRRFYTGGFARAPGMHTKYLDSYDRMIEMVGVLHRHGVRIVPGTDNLPGFAYHRELELYVESGIPANQVLQLATIRAAEVAGVEDMLGSIEVGKLADMVLLDGNPLQDISNVRKTVLTIKDGVIFDPKGLYRAVGVEP